jgi:protein-S-isoprenylcysteine O-methyltransferase Ste14
LAGLVRLYAIDVQQARSTNCSFYKEILDSARCPQDDEKELFAPSPSGTELTSGNREDRVHLAAPPPLIYLAFLVAGLLVNLLYPVPLTSILLFAVILGLATVGVGLAIGASSLKAMRNAGVSPDPSKPVPKLVDKGPFRFSRNPLYISLAVIYVGISVAFNALWPLVLLIVALIVVDRSVISREEKYLEGRFGEDYQRYKSRVRRWL